MAAAELQCICQKHQDYYDCQRKSALKYGWSPTGRIAARKNARNSTSRNNLEKHQLWNVFTSRLLERQIWATFITTKRNLVRKSWRPGTSTTVPGWRCCTGESRSIPTIHPCPYEGRLWVARQSVTNNHDATTYEPNNLHGTMRSRTNWKMLQKSTWKNRLPF